MKMKLIRKMWQEYKSKNVSMYIPKHHLIEIEKGFFSSAGFIVDYLTDQHLNNIDERTIFKILEGLANEIKSQNEKLKI